MFDRVEGEHGRESIDADRKRRRPLRNVDEVSALFFVAADRIDERVEFRRAIDRLLHIFGEQISDPNESFVFARGGHARLRWDAPDLPRARAGARARTAAVRARARARTRR